MPEYVYALHDFFPEHEDEVSFHAGERIEVVERDDQYGDGWWQGRNLDGKVGLFPQSYTAPAPPDSAPSATLASSAINDYSVPLSPTKTSLHPLQEVSESGSPQPPSISPIPTTTITDSETGETIRADGDVMKATMTDVQKAIEQLGQNRGRQEDEAGSFSFASSQGDRDTEGETDTDFDMSDLDGADVDGGQGWHKGARRKLAAKARKAVEEAEKLEALLGGLGMAGSRTVQPPIDVELSDESEGEEDFTSHSQMPPREHPHIPEEDEEAEDSARSWSGRRTASDRPTITQSSTPNPEQNAKDSVSHISIPSQDVDAPVTATQTSFPRAQTPTSPRLSFTGRQSPKSPRSLRSPRLSPELVKPSSPSPDSKRNSASNVTQLNLLPSPTAASFHFIPTAQRSTTPTKHNSVPSIAPIKPPSPPPVEPSFTASTQHTLVDEKKDKTHPSEWTVEEVVDWLKNKGFDTDVCEKFTEQEITGDVLLELDVNLLKSEIGIMAFGKRMRIANAITDLRRPPSITYSDRPELSPTSPLAHSQFPLPSASHSRNQSQSQSHHSYPGTNGQAYAQSLQSSLASPLGYGGSPNPPGSPYVFVGQDSPGPHVTEYPSSMTTKYGGDESNSITGLGLGLPSTNGKHSKGRPAQLLLSPSDGALNSSAKAVTEVPEETEEDRGHQTDSEIVPSNSIRRRLFGRSQDSAQSNGKDSKSDSGKAESANEVASPNSFTTTASTRDSSEKSKDKDGGKDKEAASTVRHARTRRSIDATGAKSSDRLSIFGTTFGSKGRKPPPRYSSDDSQIDKASIFTLPRLHSGSTRKASSNSASTAVLAPKNGDKKDVKVKPKDSSVASEKAKAVAERTKEKRASGDSSLAGRDSKEKDRDPAILRKRTTSVPNAVAVDVSSNGFGSPLKQGQSILDQIGEPDHSGWMRKRGDRYNSWKLRYFLLQGPHLYCLKSNSKAETRIKGYINIVGYRVTVDENVNPGRYGFRIDHDSDKTHYFSSDEKPIIRDWMKAIMKATIGRDYTKPVISSCNIPTIPLTVAQAMNPAPRPPSPTARDATQKALRRENPNQLSSRDARVLMGLPSSTENKEERTRLDSFFTNETVTGSDEPSVSSHVASPITPKTPVPPRPSREMRRLSSHRTETLHPIDDGLIEWANTHLPFSLRITDTTGSICSGLALLRLAESIRGRPSSPPVPDSAFPSDATDDKLDGLFRLFDFLLDNEVKMGSVSINDVRQGKRDKILQLLRALKAWEDKRKALAQSIGKSVVSAGGFIAPSSMNWNS